MLIYNIFISGFSLFIGLVIFEIFSDKADANKRSGYGMDSVADTKIDWNKIAQRNSKGKVIKKNTKPPKVTANGFSNYWNQFK